MSWLTSILNTTALIAKRTLPHKSLEHKYATYIREKKAFATTFNALVLEYWKCVKYMECEALWLHRDMWWGVAGELQSVQRMLREARGVFGGCVGEAKSIVTLYANHPKKPCPMCYDVCRWNIQQMVEEHTQAFISNGREGVFPTITAALEKAGEMMGPYLDGGVTTTCVGGYKAGGLGAVSRREEDDGKEGGAEGGEGRDRGGGDGGRGPRDDGDDAMSALWATLSNTSTLSVVSWDSVSTLVPKAGVESRESYLPG